MKLQDIIYRLELLKEVYEIKDDKMIDKDMVDEDVAYFVKQLIVNLKLKHFYKPGYMPSEIEQKSIELILEYEYNSN